MKKILVIGSTNIDFTVNVPAFPREGETVMGEGFQKIPGGKGANQAYACGKLGGQTAFISAVGDDGLGDMAVENLRKVHVNTDLIRTAENTPTGMAMITINRRGNNCIVVIPGANEICDRSMIEGLYDEIDRCDILLVQLETPLDGVMAAVERAGEKGKLVILNPAPVPEGGLPEEIYRSLTYITPNETELSRLTGLPADTIEDVWRAGQRLLDRGVENVVVTLGEKGAALINRSCRRMFDSIKVAAVDTTAAGDTFNGAMAVKIGEGCGIEEAIRFAGIASGISVTRKGAQPSVPDREEVERFIELQNTGGNY